MHIRVWNKFISTNPSATIFGAVVSSMLPPSLRLDKNGNNLPTPYKLFCEWMDASTVGTWSATAVPQGFVIGVIDQVDKANILAVYGPTRHRGFKIAGMSVPVLSYTDGSYANLALARGYQLNI